TSSSYRTDCRKTPRDTWEAPSYRRLQVCGVEHERHRTIVHEVDLHVLAERAAGDSRSERLQGAAQGLEPFLGDLRGRCAGPGRAAALVPVAVERELRHHQDFAADVRQRQVHLAVVVLEDAEVDDLLRQALRSRVVLVVA